MYVNRDWALIDDDPSGYKQIPIYFKSLVEVMAWMPLNASVSDTKDYIDEVDDIEDLWLLRIDDELSCYIRSCDLLEYIEYLRDCGHKVVVSSVAEG